MATSASRPEKRASGVKPNGSCSHVTTRRSPFAVERVTSCSTTLLSQTYSTDSDSVGAANRGEMSAGIPRVLRRAFASLLLDDTTVFVELDHGLLECRRHRGREARFVSRGATPVACRRPDNRADGTVFIICDALDQ